MKPKKELENTDIETLSDLEREAFEAAERAGVLVNLRTLSDDIKKLLDLTQQLTYLETMYWNKKKYRTREVNEKVRLLGRIIDAIRLKWKI